MVGAIRTPSIWRVGLVSLVTLSASVAHLKAAGIADRNAASKSARQMLEVSGVQGGLVVHLGCGDGRLTAALRKDETYVVHGLDTDPARVDEARRHIRSLGLYGPVSAECWDAPLLPYVDNTVNLLVAETPGAVSAEEMTRVLVPRGRRLREATATRGPRPSSRRAKASTSGPITCMTQAATPWPTTRLWGRRVTSSGRAGPRHGRSHEYTPSINAVVSAGGRIFYIADQGPIATLRKPAEWKLLARDAYNGILLWERPIGKWFSHLCGWTQGPRQLQRKLVAVGDRVYVTLGFHAPLTALDAATGETVRVYPDTEGTEEILCHKGVLLLVVREVTDARLAAYKKWEELTAQTGVAVAPERYAHAVGQRLPQGREPGGPDRSSRSMRTRGRCCGRRRARTRPACGRSVCAPAGTGSTARSREACTASN